MTPVLAAALGAILAVGALLVSRAPKDSSTHPGLSPVGSGLLGTFVLLVGFLIATGWAAGVNPANTPAPMSLYWAAVAAGGAVCVYPALASLPWTRRHTLAVGAFGAMVGYALTVAFQLRP